MLGVRSETPRAGNRQPVSLVGECSVSGSDPVEVTVLDLDAHGCKVRGLPLGVGKHDDLVLAIGPVGAIQAQLRWVKSMMAGLVFTRQLSADELTRALSESRSSGEAHSVLAFRRRA